MFWTARQNLGRVQKATECKREETTQDIISQATEDGRWKEDEDLLADSKAIKVETLEELFRGPSFDIRQA